MIQLHSQLSFSELTEAELKIGDGPYRPRQSSPMVSVEIKNEKATPVPRDHIF